jgi:hypothetical protein
MAQQLSHMSSELNNPLFSQAISNIHFLAVCLSQAQSAFKDACEFRKEKETQVFTVKMTSGHIFVSVSM